MDIKTSGAVSRAREIKVFQLLTWQELWQMIPFTWEGGRETLQWEWCHWQISLTPFQEQLELETQHRKLNTEDVTCQHQSIVCYISVTQADKLQITTSHYPNCPLFLWQCGQAAAHATASSLPASLPFKLTWTSCCPTRVGQSDPLLPAFITLLTPAASFKHF